MVQPVFSAYILYFFTGNPPAETILCMSPDSGIIAFAHLPVSSGWFKTFEQKLTHYSGGTVQDSHLLPS